MRFYWYIIYYCSILCGTEKQISHLIVLFSVFGLYHCCSASAVLSVSSYHFCFMKLDSSSKLYKVSEECRIFQERWTKPVCLFKLFMTTVRQKPVCLTVLCHKFISVLKGCNLKRYYKLAFIRI